MVQHSGEKSTVHRDMFWLGSRQIKSSMVQAAHSLQCKTLHCTAHAQCILHTLQYCNVVQCQRLNSNALHLCSAQCEQCAHCWTGAKWSSLIVYTVYKQSRVYNVQCSTHCPAVHSVHFTVVEVDSMGLKGAIERLLRRRNADTGQRIKASEERKKWRGGGGGGGGWKLKERVEDTNNFFPQMHCFVVSANRFGQDGAIPVILFVLFVHSRRQQIPSRRSNKYWIHCWLDTERIR